MIFHLHSKKNKSIEQLDEEFTIMEQLDEEFKTILKETNVASIEKYMEKACDEIINNLKNVEFNESPKEEPLEETKDEEESEESEESEEESEEEQEEEHPRRYFKCTYNGHTFGRYCGMKPKQAANKALTSLIRENGKEESVGKSFEFSVQECTRRCQNKEYHFEF